MLTSKDGANIVILHRWLNTQPDNVSQIFVHVLAKRFHFTHICIPFILRLFNYIENNDEFCCFNWFVSFIIKLKKVLDSINHMIYTFECMCSIIQWFAILFYSILFYSILFTQKPTAIYCLVLFSIGDHKLWSLIIGELLKISFSFLEYMQYVWKPIC